MIPQLNQYVRCSLRNSTIYEGIVEKWDDTQVILRSVKNDDLLIIHHPQEDIMLTFIINSFNITPNKISNKLKEVQATEDEQLKQISIQQLKHMKMQQEQEIIQNTKKQHITTPSSIYYSTPIGILDKNKVNILKKVK